MRLDPTALRYLTRDDFRVLTAVEMGMRNHDLVPRELIVKIADLRHGGVEKFISTLLRHKLLHHETIQFDGYRLTTLGYDYLALRAFVAKGLISGVGKKIGVGKESDIFLVENDEGRQMVLKLHRLGRTSFRKIKEKRDYHGKRGSPSWIYLSRLAAQKEFAYMRALHEFGGFRVPEPIEANRHCILMSLLEGLPLHTVHVMPEAEKCAETMLEMIERLGKVGLIHGDFNEFNVAVNAADAGDVIMYDFPQMVSMRHPNARFYFDRDVQCVSRFFRTRFEINLEEETLPKFDEVYAAREANLDENIRVSGFNFDERDEEVLREALTNRREAYAGGEEGEERSDEEDESREDQVDEDGEVEEDRLDESGDEDGEGEDEEDEEEDETMAKGTPASPRKESEVKVRVQKEVNKAVKRESQGGKTSRNRVKSREKRKVMQAMRSDW